MAQPPTQMVTPDSGVLFRETATEGFRFWQMLQGLE